MAPGCVGRVMLCYIISALRVIHYVLLWHVRVICASLCYVMLYNGCHEYLPA